MMMRTCQRDGPVFEPELPISFQNFHKATRASFSPCAVPDREPDFVSPGRSVYWDLETAVIRASDHWSDQNGCREIGGCHWTYEDLCRPGAWEAGKCAYTGFTRRIRVIPTRPADAEDRDLALHLSASGGGMDPRVWSAQYPGRPYPDWVRVVPRGTLAAVPAAEFLQENPDVPRVLTADRSTMRQILSKACVPLQYQDPGK